MKLTFVTFKITKNLMKSGKIEITQCWWMKSKNSKLQKKKTSKPR